VRDSNKIRQSGELLKDKNITAKEFGKKVNEKLLLTGDNASSWSNRSLDWYNSERRLIFAVDPESLAFKNLNQDFFNKVSKNGLNIISAPDSCGAWSQFLSPVIL
jgi:hypothetical protein